MNSMVSLLQNGLLIAGFVALLVTGITIIGRSRREATEMSLPSRAELLEDFRQSYERGEISQSEYLRIQEKLSGREKRGVVPQPEGGTFKRPAPKPTALSPEQAQSPPLEGRAT